MRCTLSVNQTFLNMLATVAKDHPDRWEEDLCKVCLAYNSSVMDYRIVLSFCHLWSGSLATS